MFENAELGHSVEKADYKEQVPALRSALLDAQRRLATSDFSVLIIVAGVPAGGKSEVVDLMLDWLDARGIETHYLRKPTQEEKVHPPMWRYWRALPARGRIGIFYGGWDLAGVYEVLRGKMESAALDHAVERHIEFQRMLVRENTLVLKLWLHLSKDAVRKRIKKLADDPARSWRLAPDEQRLVKRYDAFRPLAEHLLRRSSTAEAPWHVIDAEDRRYRNLTIGQTLLDALNRRLEISAKLERPKPQPLVLHPQTPNVIRSLKPLPVIAKKAYKAKLEELQGLLGHKTRKLRRKKRSLILVFEGPDAAGKGGAIRRLIAAMDARIYRVISVSAPTDEEKAHPYLWRFWRHLPSHGHVTIYDRSWYGRVLVERIEGFALPEEWQRAYGEINDFEEQLTEAGVIVIKFWLAIQPEVQLERFQHRQQTPYKQYKLTHEDWRNRAKWNSYEAAACDMIEATSASQAPWVLIEADDKKLARLKVLETVVNRLSQEIDS
jgi:polyphosphate:AMP phosphotransferase